MIIIYVFEIKRVRLFYILFVKEKDNEYNISSTTIKTTGKNVSQYRSNIGKGEIIK